jgi:hypothetical protein
MLLSFSGSVVSAVTEHNAHELAEYHVQSVVGGDIDASPAFEWMVLADEEVTGESIAKKKQFNRRNKFVQPPRLTPVGLCGDTGPKASCDNAVLQVHFFISGYFLINILVVLRCYFTTSHFDS